MTLAEIIKRKAEINARLAAIHTESRGQLTAEQLEALSTEQDKLLEERASLIQQEIELKSKVIPAVNPVVNPSDGPVVAPSNSESQIRTARIEQMSKRDKLALAIGKQARGVEFTEAEKRALGNALTTTASVFVKATSSVNGVNNAGVFISTALLLDLLKEEGKLSPIVEKAVASMTHIAGLTEFPYRKSRDKARYKSEGAAGLDNQMEWDKLTGTKGYLQTIIAITDELVALTDFDFGAYIVEQIAQDINEDWAEQIIYGDGATDHLTGITKNAISGNYSGTAVDALVAGIKLCKGKYRRNAEIYVAQDMADDVLFSTNKKGEFIHPIFNNSSGITTVGPIKINVDENLKDGEFLIGNITKYFKMNGLIPFRIETDRTPRRGITEYVASQYACSMPVPGAFVYGKKVVEPAAPSDTGDENKTA